MYLDIRRRLFGDCHHYNSHTLPHFLDRTKKKTVDFCCARTKQWAELVPGTML